MSKCNYRCAYIFPVVPLCLHLPVAPRSSRLPLCLGLRSSCATNRRSRATVLQYVLFSTSPDVRVYNTKKQHTTHKKGYHFTKSDSLSRLPPKPHLLRQSYKQSNTLQHHPQQGEAKKSQASSTVRAERVCWTRLFFVTFLALLLPNGGVARTKK